MAEKIGRNQNVSTTSTVDDGVVVAGNSAVVAAAANPTRTYLAVTIRDENAWVRSIPAASDPAVRKGVFKAAGTTYEFPIDDVYTGEVSVINDKDGKSPTFYVTER